MDDKEKTKFISLIKKELGIQDTEYARLAATAVLKTLHDRLTEGQAEHVEACLPKEIKAMWSRGLTDKLMAMWRGPDKLNKREFLNRVQERSHLRDTVKTEALTQGVFKTLKTQLPKRAIDNIESQLPKDLKNLWRAS